MGPTTKKIMPPGKTQDVLCLFCSFLKHVQNRRFCAEFGQNVSSKKEQKKIMIFVFFVLFCSNLLFLPDLVEEMSSNREQKRLYRREDRKMSFVFFSVGTPPPPIKVYL